MIRSLLVAAILAATSSSAYATTTSYTGASPDGTVSYTFAGFCDGITLTKSTNVATGFHTGRCEGHPLPFAGGFKAKILGTTTNIWIITTSDPNLAAGTEEVLLVDEQHLVWSLFAESNSLSQKFTFINSGNLTRGKPPEDIRGLKPVAFGRYR